MNYISLCFDKNYLDHIKTLIYSIIQNNKDLPITFCLFFWWNENDFLNSNIVEYIKKLWKQTKYWIFDESVANNLKSCSYLWKATYYRLYIPKLLLEANIYKTLYIDCDIINNGEICTLFDINLHNKYFAVCLENSDNKTFNAWVMLINCKKWEDDNIFQKLITFIAKNPEKIIYGDQSALNIVIKPTKYLILSPRYNLTIQYRYYFKSPYTKQQIKTEIKHAVFFHFNGRKKPRDYFCEHPFFYKWYTYKKTKSYKISLMYITNTLLIKLKIYYLKLIIYKLSRLILVEKNN